MPIFEYKCEKCGHIFERFCFGKVKEVKESCPKCGTAGAKKVISPFSSAGSSGGWGGACGPSSRGFS